MRRWVLSDEREGERGGGPRQFSNLACLWLDFLEDFGFDIKFLVFGFELKYGVGQ